MPVTFPSHAAAVLPLFRWAPRLPPLALVVGSAAPDLSYALNFGGEVAHRPSGIVDFCLPVGLFFFVWAELLVLPTLRSAVPSVFGIELGRFLRTRGPPRNSAEWVQVALAIVIGAATHQLWDGFTHRDQWPAYLLYGDTVVAEVRGRPLYLGNLLQYVSSVLGGAMVALWTVRRYPQLATCSPGSARRLLLLVAAMIAGALAALWRRRSAFMGASITWTMWLGFWTCVAGALVGLTVLCVLLRLGLLPRPLST
ncbi:MAG: DUF4184 family protein [Myxococcaceae bacterium]